MAGRPIPHSMTSTALLAVHYDATEVMQGVTEVLCYGTAIVAVQV